MGSGYGWIEVVVVGGIALGLGFWQLWSINRVIKQDRAAAAKKGERIATGSEPVADPPAAGRRP